METIAQFLKILGAFLLYFKLAGFIDWSWAAVLTPFILIGLGHSLETILDTGEVLVMFFGWLITTVVGFLGLLIVDAPVECRRLWRRHPKKTRVALIFLLVITVFVGASR